MEAMREAEERGKKTYLREARTHGGARLWRNEVGWQQAINELVFLDESARGCSLMCLVHNMKKIVRKVLDGRVSLPDKYGQLIEGVMSGWGSHH